MGIRIWGTAIFLALAPYLSSAEEPKMKSKEAQAPAQTQLNFEVVRDESGKFVLERKPVTGNPKGQISLAEPLKNSQLLDHWFVVRDKTGALDAIYGLGATTRVPSDILATLPSGSTITKTDYKGMISSSGWLVTVGNQTATEAIKEALTQMVNAAVDQVCAFRARPTEFSMNAEVKISIGVGGAIKMGMVWKTQDLCK